MTLTEFAERIDAHPDMSIVGARFGETHAEDEVIVENARTEKIYAVKIGPCKHPAFLDRTTMKHGPLTVTTLDDSTWPQMVDMLEGRRGGGVMVYVTRIVGYYSMIQQRGHTNWNRSKIAELVDRQKGDYKIGAA